MVYEFYRVPIHFIKRNSRTIPGFAGLFPKIPGQNNAIFQVKCCLLIHCRLDLEDQIPVRKRNNCLKLKISWLKLKFPDLWRNSLTIPWLSGGFQNSLATPGFPGQFATCFRHAEMFWHTKGKFTNMKRSWVSLIFSWVCQKIIWTFWVSWQSLSHFKIYLFW